MRTDLPFHFNPHLLAIISIGHSLFFRIERKADVFKGGLTKQSFWLFHFFRVLEFLSRGISKWPFLTDFLIRRNSYLLKATFFRYTCSNLGVGAILTPAAAAETSIWWSVIGKGSRLCHHHSLRLSSAIVNRQTIIQVSLLISCFGGFQRLQSSTWNMVYSLYNKLEIKPLVIMTKIF